MSAIKNGGAGEIQRVPENTTGDAFENAIRTFGVVAACEWFGHASDSEFTRDTIATLMERTATARESYLLAALQKAERALTKLAAIDCGCSPCTGSCRTGRGAEIELEDRMDAANSAAIDARVAIVNSMAGR
ncbi:hypothetical protein C6Q07_11050 [Burkholderia multivorans]|uniref:hypothetical protein n=1 Tax=Burkholderia multivorans TaxID=87883 RepID=UPI000CFF7F5C|nr:hypothetical protein [Burkholderia multivorans]MBU9635464.1 hypothetical protein [Burkholderia multivorans]PRF08631.1 hypothetical protein C6Q07_11050 [Burkholderia multivorans]